MVHKPRPISYTLAILAGVGVSASGYLGLLAYDQHQKITNLDVAASQRQSELTTASSTIAELQNELVSVRDDLEDLADDYRDAKDESEEFEDELRDLAGTLDEFERLKEIDEELLQKYSKVSFLNENYTPSRIVEIDPDYVFDRPDIADEYFHAEAYEHLEDLIRRAERAGHDLQIISAYRSFDEQRELKGQFTQIYGEGANTFSADQGFSEHQLGTAVDFTVPAIGATSQTFAKTEAYEWLLDNAYKYGFVLSYPEGNDFYIFEPWHWRFVGRDLARDLNRSDDRTFYTMDQREIDEYLLEIFD